MRWPCNCARPSKGKGHSHRGGMMRQDLMQDVFGGGDDWKIACAAYPRPCLFRSTKQHSAVNVDIGTGDKGTVVTGEEDDKVSNIDRNTLAL